MHGDEAFFLKKKLPHRVGIRAQSVCSLTWACFEGLDSDLVRLTLANTKNISARLATADLPFFKSVLVPGPDPRVCAVEALRRQKKLVENHALDPYDFCFRACNAVSRILEPRKASESVPRMAAELGFLLGFLLTFFITNHDL